MFVRFPFRHASARVFAAASNPHALLALVAGTLASTATAQWTVVNLHPPGASWSEARGVDGQQVVGVVAVNFVPVPSLWNGPTSAWVNLHPAVALGGSEMFGVGGGQQAGTITTDVPPFQPIRPKAALWTGTAASVVDLNPAAATGGSRAYGVGGGQQVGHILVGVIGSPAGPYAGLWTGSAASFVSLHPPAALFSVAYGTDGNQQAGEAYYVGNGSRASLWTGTAASWVDLHPPGMFESEAKAVSGGQQVGNVRLSATTTDTHASLWTGTAASWVDLNPVGSGFSFAEGVSGGIQVGWAFLDSSSEQHASLWTGSASSWVDLHTFLPAGFFASQATDVWTDGHTILVSGIGENLVTGRFEALLWVGSNNTSFCYGDGTGTACPCANNGSATRGCANSASTIGALLSKTSGSTTVSLDTAQLQVDSLPVGAPCLFFQGTTQASGIAFGDGLLCLSGAITRLAVVFSASGVANAPLGLANLGGIPATGGVRTYQAWYRDGSPTFCTSSTFNLSNGLELSWSP